MLGSLVCGSVTNIVQQQNNQLKPSPAAGARSLTRANGRAAAGARPTGLGQAVGLGQANELLQANGQGQGQGLHSVPPGSLKKSY